MPSAVKNTHFLAKHSRSAYIKSNLKFTIFHELEIWLHSHFSIWWNHINALGSKLVIGENNWMQELHCVLSSSMIGVRNFLQSECCPLSEGEATTRLLKTLITTVRRWSLSFCSTIKVILIPVGLLLCVKPTSPASALSLTTFKSTHKFTKS